MSQESEQILDSEESASAARRTMGRLTMVWTGLLVGLLLVYSLGLNQVLDPDLMFNGLALLLMAMVPVGLALLWTARRADDW